MAFYAEEDVWKCPRHPSRRRLTGVCPVCLKERLSALCPDCASLRPCCYCSTSSSSSSSSSFSLHFSDAGSVGRISTLIDSEPAFRRSRSFAVIRSSRFSDAERKSEVPQNQSKSSSIWSSFWPSMLRKEKTEDVEKMKLRRSRSVAAPITAGSEVRSSPAAKGKSWYFRSPMKVFRQSKVSKAVVRERSPLPRG